MASEGWRKRLGVEPSPPAERGATGFEDREGHRAPFASDRILPLGGQLGTGPPTPPPRAARHTIRTVEGEIDGTASGRGRAGQQRSRPGTPRRAGAGAWGGGD